MARIKKFSKMSPLDVLVFFFKEERRSSGLLLGAALIAIILANSSLKTLYFGFVHHHIHLFGLSFDIQHWVSEGLMSIFFLVVGLEVKREFIDGELRSWRRASFPLFAAIGGMAVPALLYVAINPSQPQLTGWAIPMATDIAIAVGILGLLGSKVSKNLRLFLLTLAIIDDIGSILVISIFYSRPTSLAALLLAGTMFSGLLVVSKLQIWRIPFAVISAGLLFALLMSGISGTIAGILIAVAMPLQARIANDKELQTSELLEDVLLPFSSYIVVPLFVFTSAGLDFSKVSIFQGGGLGVYLGAVVGLVLGKPLGILCMSMLATRLGLTKRPRGVSWSQVAGIGCLAGVGFTIALLVADLSFSSIPGLHNAAILGVFTASVISAIIGLGVLAAATARNNHLSSASTD